MRRPTLVLLICLTACITADDDDDAGDEDAATGDDTGGSGSPTSTATSAGSTAAEGEASAGADTSGYVCGLYNTDDVCTTCVIDSCCAPSQTCADDQMCLTCFQLMNAGDVLGAQQMGCFEYAVYLGLYDCINDPSGCGPICSPPASCSDYGCVVDSDCVTVGCSACTVTGTCQ